MFHQKSTRLRVDEYNEVVVCLDHVEIRWSRVMNNSSNAVYRGISGTNENTDINYMADCYR